MNKRTILVFWGVMDLVHILGFVYWNISRGRIPVYDDMASFVSVGSSYGGSMPLLLFSSALLLNFSIVLTMVMFFKQYRFIGVIACLQTPLRLFLVVPSLSFIPWLVSFYELKQVAIVFILLIFSEVFKLASLWWVLARQPIGG